MADYYLRNPKTGDPLVMRENQKPFVMSPYFMTFGAGGWGSRKTWAGLGFIEQSIWMNPGCDGIFMAPIARFVREILYNLIRPALGPLVTGETRQDNILHLATGGRIIGLSAHDPQMLEHYTAAWAYIDEAAAMKEEIFAKMAGRVRDERAKHLRIGLTSVPYWCWLRDKFEGQTALDRTIMRLRTDDNTDLHPDAARHIRESTTARMAPCHLDGQWVTPGGTVHPGFGERNLIDWPEPVPTLLTGVVLDWSPRAPHATFFQVIPAGTKVKHLGRVNRLSVVIFDEIYDFPEDPVTTPRLCSYVKAKRYPLKQAIGDPAGKAVEATSGLSSRNQAQDALRLPIEQPPKNLSGKAARIEHVNLALEPLAGAPTLYVARHMANDQHPRAMVPSFRAYSYPKDKEGKPLSNIPNEDGITEHGMDTVQYLVSVVLPTYDRIAGPQTRSYI